MPRYYFGYETEAPETYGDELADDDAARKVALKVSEELGRGRPARPRIAIFNEDGQIIEPGGGLIIDINFASRPTQH
jgi:hypothetical protein